MGKKIVIDAPKNPVVRYRIDGDRRLTLDLRGIRNPHNPMNGRLNPSVGGTKKFLSPEHLQSMVNEYFESCMGPAVAKGELLRDDNGNLVKIQVKPFTVSGLALHLGVSTTTLKNYKRGDLDTILDEMRAQVDDVPTFARVIQKALQTIEAYSEGRLYDRDGSNGARFVLDVCFGWTTQREAAEIYRTIEESKLRREEFDLKRKLIDEADEDDEFTINIIRGRRAEDDDS